VSLWLIAGPLLPRRLRVVAARSRRRRGSAPTRAKGPSEQRCVSERETPRVNPVCRAPYPQRFPVRFTRTYFLAMQTTSDYSENHFANNAAVALRTLAGIVTGIARSLAPVSTTKAPNPYRALDLASLHRG